MFKSQRLVLWINIVVLDGCSKRIPAAVCRRLPRGSFILQESINADYISRQVNYQPIAHSANLRDAKGKKPLFDFFSAMRTKSKPTRN
jgi:hypothetical protein